MNRTVKLKAHYPNGRTDLLDLDTTSDAGAWALKAVDISGADRLKAKSRRSPNTNAGTRVPHLGPSARRRPSSGEWPDP